METKGGHPAQFIQNPQTSPLLAAWFEVNQLKQLYRQGWLKRGVEPAQCESVAEHSFGVAMLTMWLVDAYYPELDALKAMRMALIHDLGEVYVGDITPSHKIEKSVKLERERAAVEKVLGKLPNGQLYLALWEEYEENSTPEAVLIKQVDRLEMAMQAGVYENLCDLDLIEFMDSAQKVVDRPQLQVLLDQLKNRDY